MSFKNLGGRPLKYETKEDLQAAIDKYWQYCEEQKKVPCIAGLAYYIGVDRHTVYNYEKNDKFFHTIKIARDKILYKLEESVCNTNSIAAGKIFVMKNYGYTDKQELELTKKLSKDDEKELNDIFVDETE